MTIKKKKEDSPEALKSLASKYEDILEAHIRVLYMRMVNFIAASQLPLVHVNIVLDLLKKDIVEQLKDGYFPTEKQE
jgi:hypothetical protein